MRVKPEEVRAIIETEMLDLSPFIKAANLQCTKHLSDVEAGLLKEIERWLAAHYIAVKEAQETSDQQTLIMLRNRYGLSSTFYGQQALALDPTGKLAALGRRAVEFKVL